MAFYWQIKTFRSRETFDKFIEKNERKIQWHTVFISNVPYAIEWKDMKVIKFD